MAAPLSVSKNHPAQQCPSLLLEEKVSPVHTLVTDVVENVTISPAVWYKTQHFAAHHISQKSVPKCRFLPASPRGEAFFPILYFFDSLTPPVAEATGGALLGFIRLQKLFYPQGIVLLSIRKAFSADCGFFSPIRLFQGLSASLSASVM